MFMLMFPPALRPVVVLVGVVGVLLMTSSLAEAKYVSGKASVTSLDTEVYVDKFSFSRGAKGVIKGTFSSGDSAYFDQRPHSLEVALFSDEAWDRYHAMLDKGSLCIERLRQASFRKSIGRQAANDIDHARGTHGQRFGFSAEVGTDALFANVAKQRAHFWYVVVADCMLEEYDARKHPPLTYKMDFRNGGSHLPADESGLPLMHLVAMLVLAGGAFVGYDAARTSFQEVGQIHLIVLLLAAATVLAFGSISAEWLHLAVYTLNGRGLRWRHSFLPMDFYSDVLSSMCEMVMLFTLLALAFGWTLDSTSIATGQGVGADESDGSKARRGVIPGVGMQLNKLQVQLSQPARLFRRFTYAGVVMACAAFTELTLLFWGRSYEGDFATFHDHEHAPGKLRVLLRMVLGLLFFAGCSLQVRRVSSDPDLSKFVRNLLVLGTIWIAAFPTIVFFVGWLPPYRRHPVIVVVSMLLQSGALASLGYITLAHGSSYRKVSTLKNLGTVFSGGGGGLGGGTAKGNWMRKLKGKVAVD